jgi:membrane protease YdiL (CAAX protease family)
MQFRQFIKNHPLGLFFALTFVISWGGVLLLGGPMGMPAPKQEFEAEWPMVFLPYLLGPSIAGLVMTSLLYGFRGNGELFRRFAKLRVASKWYLVAIFTAPVLIGVILFALSRVSSSYLPAVLTSDEPGRLVLMGIAIGVIFGGFLEEIGWTGFAVPILRQNYGIFATGFILGALWGVWHILPTYWGSGDEAGKLSINLLLPPCIFYVGVLPAYRILMLLVYDRSGSLFVNMLMHASLTAASLFILAPKATGAELAVYYLILSAITWLVVWVAIRRNKVLS